MIFNENDDYTASWLARLYPGATVDRRSISELGGCDLGGHSRVHLFAGIGGWEYALELAGWPKNEPVWTGSCPCQPFSNAGKGGGINDERHLWPEMCRLISECLPPVVFGEQVASKTGRAWLAGVRADMEALGYRFAAADLCAAGIGAPHIRQRLFWVADTTELFCYIGNDYKSGIRKEVPLLPEPRNSGPEKVGRRLHWETDQPRLFEMADGVSKTGGRTRAYGSAIVSQLAAEFIIAYRESR